MHGSGTTNSPAGALGSGEHTWCHYPLSRASCAAQQSPHRTGTPSRPAGAHCTVPGCSFL